MELMSSPFCHGVSAAPQPDLAAQHADGSENEHTEKEYFLFGQSIQHASNAEVATCAAAGRAVV
jgi:hypothetical protein